MITFEELWLSLETMDRRKQLHDLVVDLASTQEASRKPFGQAWQEAVEQAEPVVAGWIAEDFAAGMASLPKGLLAGLL